LKSSGGSDPLIAAIRNLAPREFEALTQELADRWPPLLQSHGIPTAQPGFGVFLKARWQNLPRALRADLASAFGAVAEGVTARGEASARVEAVAAVYGAVAGEVVAVRGGPAPGVLAERLSATTRLADQAVEAASAALGQGRACPDDLPRAVREYNDAMTAARRLLSEHGIDPLPSGRSAIVAALEELAANSEREPLRAVVETVADIASDLPLLREAGRRAAELAALAPVEWDAGQVKLAEGLAMVVELRRLAAAGDGPTELLAVAARAQSSLPVELHGLTILAASGSFPLVKVGHTPAQPARNGSVPVAVA
jgi:hypothetical protein